jgi:hypothetical protein
LPVKSHDLFFKGGNVAITKKRGHNKPTGFRWERKRETDISTGQKNKPIKKT